jgi:hypothetical protein
LKFENLNPQKENFIINVFPKLMDTLSEQWYQIGDMEEYTHGECELCGKKETKYMYCIENRFNKNHMIVGSTCIEDFKGINMRIPEGLTLKQYNQIQIKKFKELSRIHEFTQEFGNIEKRIKMWDDEYNSLQFEVSLKIHLSYIQLLRDAKIIYKEYIAGNFSKNSFIEFKSLVSKQQLLIKQANYICNDNKNKMFPCPKAVATWLNNNKKRKLLHNIRDNAGIISKLEISYIYEPNFVKSIVPKFKQMFLESNLKIVKIEDNYMYFEYLGKNIYKLKISLKNLMGKYSKYLYIDDYKINEEELIKNLSLIKDNNNLLMINELEILLKKTNYRVEELEYAKGYFKSYLVDIGVQKYAKEINNIIDFLDSQKHNILINKSSINLINVISALSWTNKSELEDINKAFKNKKYHN